MSVFSNLRNMKKIALILNKFVTYSQIYIENRL